ncbi:type II secretion system F family protein [Candidatus Pacearchaeota archaeon]|nr:type II secretion system F family protein [Candidatus Pacearchaeota archaeon]
MKFKIPFTLGDIEILKKKTKFFSTRIKPTKKSALEKNLKNLGLKITREEYLGICFSTFVKSIILFYIIGTIMLFLFKINYFYVYSLIIAFMFSIFIFFAQNMYPRIYLSKKQREIEKDLIPALEDIMIQLNSGIPLFNIMVNISGGNYGELSLEFKKAVKSINAGVPEADALNELGKKNSSIFFRRALWQIANGMNAGSDMSIVIKDSIKALNEEQIIQIQTYGNKLNPLIVLYMLMAVIVPALSVTFLTIISSMVDLPSDMTMMLFISLFVFDVLFQIMFLGLIKSKRPSLL